MATKEDKDAAIGCFIIVLIVIVLSYFLHWAFSSGVTPPETCQSPWISFNEAGLEADLESKLFGQHIASRIILKALKGFLNSQNPEKPLVLSLHGNTGTGKNHISSIIAKNMYRKGMDSKYVHLFTTEQHFQKWSEIDTYKAQLQHWIKGNVTNCTQSMFIFDEMDKMHPGLIDSIKPYLDYYTKLDGVSYRKSIFIFLSNAGGDSIAHTTLDFIKEGRDRSEIRLKDLESPLSVSVFNDKESGLWHSRLIEKNLVDFFVPFLPLEFQHVVRCVLTAMKDRGLTPNKDVAERLARDLMYFPKFERIFSVTGCKTISSRLEYYL